MLYGFGHSNLGKCLGTLLSIRTKFIFLSILAVKIIGLIKINGRCCRCGMNNTESKTTITRKYSISEIDQMRTLLPNIMFPTIWYSRTFGAGFGGSYHPVERKKEIEERLRTYLMAGVSLEELKKEAEDIYTLSEKKRLSLPESKR